jgi:hypothetical protein
MTLETWWAIVRLLATFPMLLWTKLEIMQHDFPWRCAFGLEFLNHAISACLHMYRNGYLHVDLWVELKILY